MNRNYPFSSLPQSRHSPPARSSFPFPTPRPRATFSAQGERQCLTAKPSNAPHADAAWCLGPIVDADAHIDPPHDMWAQYLPAKFKDQAPVIEEGEENDWIVFEGNRRPVRMINNQAGRTGKDFKMVGKMSEQRAVWEPATRLADMDMDGIDAAILFGGGPLPTFNSELYIASYEAYSRWVMDFCAADKRRLVPIGYVPMRDVAETIAIVKTMAKMGFRAINLPAFPQNPDGWSTTAGVKAINAGQGSALTGDPQGKLQYWQPEFDAAVAGDERSGPRHQLSFGCARAAFWRKAVFPARYADEQNGDGRTHWHLRLQRHFAALSQSENRQRRKRRGLVWLVCRIL